MGGKKIVIYCDMIYCDVHLLPILGAVLTNCAQAWERVSICFNGTWWMDGLGIELFNFPVDFSALKSKMG